MIGQQIAWLFEHYSECLSNPLPFYATQIIHPFLNSSISANHDKRLEHSNAPERYSLLPEINPPSQYGM